MIIEVYKPLKRYEGYYEISNLGNIKSLDRNRKSRCKGLIFLKSIKNALGYYQINLHKQGRRKTINIHRLVALHFVDNPNNKKAINHIDGDKLNNCATNLEWCTPKENTQHAILLGLFDPTIKRPHKRYKLCATSISDILKSTLRHKHLALKYGVTRQYVGLIRKLNS